MWWAGAGMLVAGSVVIGRREEGMSDVGSEGEGLVRRDEVSAGEEEEEEEEGYKDRTSGVEEDVGLVALEPGEVKLKSFEKR